MGKKKIQRLHTPCSIHIHSRRFRFADPDGVSAKAAIDGLVHAGLLSNDTGKEIKEVTYTQEKVFKSKGGFEETIIGIRDQKL